MNLDAFIQNYKKDMVEDIISLVHIPSVFDPQTQDKGQPFGENIKKALDTVLEKAKEMGMQTRNLEGYAGEITVGTGAFIIGVLAHIDVVAAGDGWDTPAFSGTVKENKLFGRGSADDKGPLISSLYAIKYLLDEHRIPDGTSIRLIIGTNEEEDWKCMEYYREHVSQLPNFSIVPDGYFPLISCEKGLLDLDITIPLKQQEAPFLRELSGGNGRNIVPSKASCLLEYGTVREAEKAAEQLSLCQGISACAEGRMVHAVSEGIGVHAMTPEKGINAIGQLMDALGSLEEWCRPSSFAQQYNHYIGQDYHGKGLNCDVRDEMSGRTTFNVGVIQQKDNYIALEADLRYPVSWEKNEVVHRLSTTCDEAGFGLQIRNSFPPIFRDPDSEFVKRLLGVYREETGDTACNPIAIGGATYARVLPNAVAYGPLFPHEVELAHMPNENLNLESLERMTRIYARALESLLQMK